MDRQIRQLGVALLVLFGVLFIRLNQIQVFQSESLTANPLNARRIVRDFGGPRGDIITSDGLVIASSVEVEGDFNRERRYVNGPMYAHITGYFSFEFGATGVERTYNDELSGQTDQQRFRSALDFFGDGLASGNLTLTIDSAIQQAAADALGQRNGSVVAIDPRTGAIRAYLSQPSYDPNLISDTDLGVARAAKDHYDDDAAVPLLTRAHREVFPPGSTFKVITAASALETGAATPTAPLFEPTSEYDLPLTDLTLSNFGGQSCGGNLARSLELSCNTTFAELGAEYLGPDLLTATAERFGFNHRAPFDLPLVVESRFPTEFGARVVASERDPNVSIVEGSSLLAQAAIGQFDVRATPLQMALVAAGVANRGEIMKPYVGAQITQVEDAEVIYQARPSRWRRAVEPEIANSLAEMMIGVVESGTASSLRRTGLRIGAKTGTAELDRLAVTADTHAWIIAFAGPHDRAPELAVAVLVEAVSGTGQQTGSATAGPIAAAVFDAAFG